MPACPAALTAFVRPICLSRGLVCLRRDDPDSLMVEGPGGCLTLRLPLNTDPRMLSFREGKVLHPAVEHKLKHPPGQAAVFPKPAPFKQLRGATKLQFDALVASQKK